MPLAKRLGIVAIAVAVPALATEGTMDALQTAPAEETVTLMPFETPGQSFPGSAFYYLEDTPHVIEAQNWDEPVEVIGEPALASGEPAALPLAVAPLRINGSDRDHLRAQQCMAQAIYYEAASESDAGQRAVAQVVLNRVAHPAYPRNVCGVVYQGSERRTGCQFTFTCDGSLARQPSSAGFRRASRIAREALSGVVYAPVGTATHYHTLAVHPYWASSLESVGVIGAHIFYRWPGAAGQPEAFTAGYSGAEPMPSRAHVRTAQAPDPTVAVSVAGDRVAGPATGQPNANAATLRATESEPQSEILPQSGDVRSEYANAGRWIERP